MRAINIFRKIKEDSMKKVLVVLFVAAAAFTFACSSSQTTQQAETPQVSSGAGMMVSATNEALKPAADALDVFQPSSAALTSRNRSLISSKAVAVIKEVVNKVPEGYVIQVTGHSAMVKDAATDDVSTNRAKAVYNELLRAGIDRNKLTYKGIATSEMLPGLDGLDPKQRRVSFKVVPK